MHKVQGLLALDDERGMCRKMRHAHGYDIALVHLPNVAPHKTAIAFLMDKTIDRLRTITRIISAKKRFVLAVLEIQVFGNAKNEPNTIDADADSPSLMTKRRPYILPCAVDDLESSLAKDGTRSGVHSLTLRIRPSR